MTARRLLKSCATPPARRPTLSIRWDWSSCSRRRLDSVMSAMMETSPVTWPAASRWGAAEVLLGADAAGDVHRDTADELHPAVGGGDGELGDEPVVQLALDRDALDRLGISPGREDLAVGLGEARGQVGRPEFGVGLAQDV